MGKNTKQEGDSARKANGKRLYAEITKNYQMVIYQT